MIRLLMLLFLATFSLCCAHGPKIEPTPSHREFYTPPASMKAAVIVICGNNYGIGTPLTTGSLLTAFHVIDGCMSAEWKSFDGMRGGSLMTLAFNRERDWAILASQGVEFSNWANAVRERPLAGERLWWFIPRQGGSPVAVSGVYIGLDGDSDLSVDGTVWPGSSGSGIFNGDGDVVGYVKGINGPTSCAVCNRIVYGGSMGEVFKK